MHVRHFKNDNASEELSMSEFTVEDLDTEIANNIAGLRRQMAMPDRSNDAQVLDCIRVFESKSYRDCMLEAYGLTENANDSKDLGDSNV